MTTLEERKEQERKQKEWVKARIGCTMQGVLASLKSTLHYDVNTYNDSFPNNKFEVNNIDGNEGVIISKTGDNNTVVRKYIAVRIKDSSIHVSHNEEPTFTITPRWDENSLECKLFIDTINDSAFTYPQISQRAIGELLFRPPDYPVSAI